MINIAVVGTGAWGLNLLRGCGFSQINTRKFVASPLMAFMDSTLAGTRRDIPVPQTLAGLENPAYPRGDLHLSASKICNLSVFVAIPVILVCLVSLWQYLSSY